MTNGGLEIYTASNINTTLVNSMVTNITNYTDSTTSSKTLYKVLSGIYSRDFTESEIQESKTEAKQAGYEAYDITEETPYFAAIRETGGIATNAYMDGRNENYGTNVYYNSNIGVESYLIEFGYLTCDDDLENIIYNKTNYVQAIADSIKEYLE